MRNLCAYLPPKEHEAAPCWPLEAASCEEYKRARAQVPTATYARMPINDIGIVGSRNEKRAYARQHVVTIMYTRRSSRARVCETILEPRFLDSCSMLMARDEVNISESVITPLHSHPTYVRVASKTSTILGVAMQSWVIWELRVVWSFREPIRDK